MLGHWESGEVLGPAQYWVQREVNKVLGLQLGPVILPFQDGEIRLATASLLGAIYYSFAREMRRQAVGAR